MRTPLLLRQSKRAFTLLEMSMVIMVLLALVSTGFVSSRKMNEWKLGRNASETVRSVYTAQRLYLADNPTANVANITSAQVIPYLPSKATVMPTVKSLTGATLSIIVNVSPPIINAGSGTRYDPSGSFTDSLWDVGE
jgi:prepilin-type N-terminal cleavage/methylation domain-containing protein